jgi:hypothetical protein
MIAQQSTTGWLPWLYDAFFRGQERNFLPDFEHRGPVLIAGGMNSQANIFGANGAGGRPDRIIRPYAFTLTALVGNTQQDRSGAIK